MQPDLIVNPAAYTAVDRAESEPQLATALNALAPSVLGYILQMLVGRRFGGHVTWDELGLPCTDSGMALPCGATGRWMSK